MTLVLDVAIYVDQYYTDGTRLYRIDGILEDGTLMVENCETLFTHNVPLDLAECWKEVKVKY